jgi:hypothetical protein
MKYRKYPNWVILTNKEIPFPYKYEVEKVLEHDEERDAYWVKWKGYTPEV